MPLEDDREARSLDASTGYSANVYVARRPSDGAIKVGASTLPRARIRQLSREAGEPLELVGTLSGGFRREAAMHRRLAPHRIGETEWYRGDVEVVRYVVALLPRPAGY